MGRKIFSGMLAALALLGCTATLVKSEPQDSAVKTIRMNTGSMVDDGVYKSAFERAADKACEGRSYEVTERTRAPSTLVNSGFELEDSNNFYWVVRCSK